jgi:hypothetical protein
MKRAVFAAAVALLFRGMMSAATIVVNDAGDALNSPGRAVTGTGTCTLRDALTFANANPGSDTIVFAIPGTGVHVIQPQAALPNVTDDGLTIDGYTQPGASLNTLARGDDAVLLVQIDGFDIPGGGGGMLELFSSNNLVRGLVLTNYGIGAGIEVAGSNTRVVGNFIGTDPSGMTAQPSRSGAGLDGSGNTLGGPLPADRNIIVGSTLNVVGLTIGHTVQGNYIGTNKDGSAGLGSLFHGVATSGDGNVIGGAGAGAGNLISGNGAAFGSGVLLASSGNSVVGNLIGTDRDGVLPVPNGGNGVFVLENTSTNVIAANTIAFNTGAGVQIGQEDEAPTSSNQVSQNRIWGNGGLGIDLGNQGVLANDPDDADVGANMLQNYPDLIYAFSDGLQTTVTGLLESIKGNPYVLEFFANPTCDPSGHGQGRTFLGTAAVTAGLNFAAVLPVSASGFVVATATDASANTSEFSACMQIVFDSVASQPPFDSDSEFQVNTYTTGPQSLPSVAENASGSFVVAWESDGQDGSGLGVFAQRYDAAGVAQGGEFQVNTATTLSNQDIPSVGMDAAGNFLVAWRSEIGDGSGSGIFARRYDSAGSPVGGEFQVNTYTPGAQVSPSVGMNALGYFVIAWSSDGSDGSGYGIAARRFDSAGNALGAEFQVNQYATGDQLAPSVAMGGDANFAVAWQSADQDGAGTGIFARRFDGGGVPLGDEFQVNSASIGNQDGASVAMNTEGDFVVAWASDGDLDGSGRAVFARRFDFTGVAQGAQFLVNTDTSGDQDSPRVGMDDQGNFVVVWTTFAISPSFGVSGRSFLASGRPAGPEFRVNAYEAGAQDAEAVAMNASGSFVIAWQSMAQDGDDYGIFARRSHLRAAQPMKVDAGGDGTTSNLNGVLEQGETVIVAPAWRNTGSVPLDLGGTASDLSGPGISGDTILDATAAYGTITPGSTNSCAASTGDCYAVSITSARTTPHWDEYFTETLTDGFTKTWRLHVGGSFSDTPPANPFYFFVEDVFHNGVTSGCGGSNYCPSNLVLRKQMAVFVLKAAQGPGFVPPPAVGIFTDVPATDSFAPWIEELYNRGVVAGCGSGPTYCPEAPVLRQQMAVFLLKTEFGPDYQPGGCAGIYADVPCSNPFAPWIETITSYGIAAGCGGGNFCPTNPTTRGQMAAFLSRAFGLLLYGP